MTEEPSLPCRPSFQRCLFTRWRTILLTIYDVTIKDFFLNFCWIELTLRANNLNIFWNWKIVIHWFYILYVPCGTNMSAIFKGRCSDVCWQVVLTVLDWELGNNCHWYISNGKTCRWWLTHSKFVCSQALVDWFMGMWCNNGKVRVFLQLLCFERNDSLWNATLLWQHPESDFIYMIESSSSLLKKERSLELQSSNSW